MKQHCFWPIMVLVFSLSGCVNSKWSGVPILAIPEQPGYEEQLELFQISQELLKRKLDDDTRIQLLYTRSQLYDKFGMAILAQSDLLRILRLRSDIPEIYNQLGGYATKAGELDSAYLAYDSALELDPEYSFSYLNRGIALYNGERYQLATEDFKYFYKNIQEPIILLWIYLSEEKVDKKMAQANLKLEYDKIKDNKIWGTDIIEFYLGKISEKTLIERIQKNDTSNKVLAEHLTEVYFYLGKHYLNRGDKKSAEILFKLTLANNIRYFIEYRQAALEIEKLTQKKN